MNIAANSVWSHLLGPMLLVVVPVAAVILFVAYSGLDAAVQSVRATQVAAAEGRAHAIQSWLDASGRSLANEAVATAWLNSDRCAKLADWFLRRNSGFVAVRFFDESAQPCSAGAKTDFSSIDGGSARASDDPGYRLIVSGSALWIATTHSTQSDQRAGSSALVVDREALRRNLPPLAALGETHVALVTNKGIVLAEDGGADKLTWAPVNFQPPRAAGSWREQDAAGEDAAFVLSPVSESSDLFILMRFDDERLKHTRVSLGVVSVSLLFMLALLGAAYARTISRDVVRWIKGLESAALARGIDPESHAKAPVHPSMPVELRSVAETFNVMADTVRDRQRALTDSAAENKLLMLEMHHRIKNSLQVIQSYLALIRRSAASKSDAPILSRIEVRVAVLAVAYRLALTATGMRPVRAKSFLEEIAAGAVSNLRRPRQRATLAFQWPGELEIDRAIPLGLAVVEALIAAFDRIGAQDIAVVVRESADGIELRVTSDGAQVDNSPPVKIMLGLAGQLGATSAPCEAMDVLIWRFAA